MQGMSRVVASLLSKLQNPSGPTFVTTRPSFGVEEKFSLSANQGKRRELPVEETDEH